MKGIDVVPNTCPGCGEDSFEQLFVMRADKKSKLLCSNYECEYEYQSKQAIQELPRGEQICYRYTCDGSLELVDEGLYRCLECGRYNGLASTSRGTLYSASVCPLCMTVSPQNIDFHHWDYDRDIGVHLCRDCHNQLHDGKRAREQTRDSPDGESWHVDAANNLIGLHESIHGRADSWSDFFKRYNLPDNHPEYADIRTLEL